MQIQPRFFNRDGFPLVRRALNWHCSIRSILIARWCLFLLILLGVTVPAQAHYDDVHFALTYYIARQVGYTPEQAFRIAKANVSVDYAYPTEPVQASTLYAKVKSLAATESAQEPRWRFHAFRNEYLHPGVTDPKTTDRAALLKLADAEIKVQRGALWTLAIDDGNPGVFLHFLQDEIPHAGFGSAYGHWPIVMQSDIDHALALRLPMGGSTDWLDYHPQALNMEMVQISFEALKRYMEKIAPKQKPRTFNASEFADVLRALRRANPAPAPLKDELLETFTEIRTDMARGFGWDLINSYATKHHLDAIQTRDANAHQLGPSFPPAAEAINAEMKRRGLSVHGSWETPEILPAPPTSAEASYPYDDLGHLTDHGQADSYVLTGTLSINVERPGTNSNTADHTVKVTIRLAKTRAQLEEPNAVLTESNAMQVNGMAQTFKNLPIGGLIIEVSSPGEATIRAPLLLEKQSDAITVTLPARAEQDHSAGLLDDLSKEEARLSALLASLRGQLEQVQSGFEAQLANVQNQLARRDATASTLTRNSNPNSNDLSGAQAICTGITNADQILANTLSKLESEQAEIETALHKAQQIAARCHDISDVTQAQDKLRLAESLAQSIDQQANALALLALQVDALQDRRQQLLKRRTTAGATPAHAVIAPKIDLTALNSALASLLIFDRAWSTAAADRERPGLAQIIAAAPRDLLSNTTTATTRIQQLLDAIAVLGLKTNELQQAQAQVAALRARALSGIKPVNNGGASNDSTSTAQTDSSACLDHAPPDVRQGMAQADTLRVTAQLAVNKLGGAAQAQLQTCQQQLNSRPIDHSAAVAAKNCRYPSSEAVWDDIEQRPMCRCKAGSVWNSNGDACETDQQHLLNKANCSRYPNTEPRWSDAKNKVVCSCRDGYQAIPGQQVCVANQATALAQQQCLGAHSEPYWNPQSLSADCRCQSGYVIDDIFKQCVLDWKAEVRAKDCSSYGDAEAYWDASKNRAGCRCSAGYKRDPASNTCLADIATQLANTDCSTWPNTAPHWDTNHNKVKCQCNSGYRYNSDSQACERDINALLANTDCSRWPNSEPNWNREQQRVNCECIAGTRYNRNNERCERELSANERVAALNCSAYANTVPYWDQTENRPMCGCRAGYQKALYESACEAIPVVIDCNTASEAGTNPPQTITINIGAHIGVAQFRYEMFDVADRMIIEYGGRTIADTGCVSGAGTLNLNLTGYSTQVIIQVQPNCQGSTNTKWNFTLSCPR